MKKIYGFQIDSDYVNERMSENHDQIFDIENRSRRNNLHLNEQSLPHVPAFRLNTDQKNSDTDSFQAVNSNVF